MRSASLIFGLSPGVVPIAFNVHPSVLPLYRGATPLQSAIRDGRTETGVTIIAMDAGMDTGDVLLQERTLLGETESYGELHDRLASRGAVLVVEALERYANGSLERRPQAAFGIAPSEIAATSTRPLRKEDLVIGGALSAKQTVDLVRSLAPSPAARTRDGVGSYGPAKILKAHRTDEGPHMPHADTIPGRLIANEGSLWIEATDGLVAVDELIVPGGKRMTAEQFRHGNRQLTAPVGA